MAARRTATSRRDRATAISLFSYDQRFDIIAQLGIAQQSYGANTFYSAKYNNQYEKTDHGLASLNLSLHNQEDLGVAPQFYYNKFKDHYQLIRGKGWSCSRRELSRPRCLWWWTECQRGLGFG